MPTNDLVRKFYDKLTASGWLGISIDEEEGKITCPLGDLLKSDQDSYTLNFYSYNNGQFYERSSYRAIIFPKSMRIMRYLKINRFGNYKLSYERPLKKILNPLSTPIDVIEVVDQRRRREIINGRMIVSRHYFYTAVKDASSVFKSSRSYATSTENYLSKVASKKYSDDARQTTTYINKGEFSFIIDRLNLSTKKRKGDYLQYLDIDDRGALENLFGDLLQKEVLSEEFLRRLNDYFIKERLKDIIAIGQEILELGVEDVRTSKAQVLLPKIGIQKVGQLEGIWQKYFERYLLYLIFSYKKIYPKVELKDIEGDKKFPDFIGINHYNGLDVIEIKTHLTKVMVWDSSHKNYYFSPEMSKAIVQTTNYLDAIVQNRFTKEADRSKITSSTDKENLYHPKGIIIISSANKLTNNFADREKLNRDFTKLRNGVHNIQILTFDEILDIATEYIKNIVDSIDN